MDDRPFENVRDQIGFCGIWCGSCAVGNGALRELTKRYEDVVKGYGLEGCAGCDQPEACDSAELLRVMRTGALDAGLMVDTENADRKELIRMWSAEIRGRWPSSVLFTPDR
jgi:hypothetical protein